MVMVAVDVDVSTPVRVVEVVNVLSVKVDVVRVAVRVLNDVRVEVAASLVVVRSKLRVVRTIIG
jgi:hypothetical protein